MSSLAQEIHLQYLASVKAIQQVCKDYRHPNITYSVLSTIIDKAWYRESATVFTTSSTHVRLLDYTKKGNIEIPANSDERRDWAWTRPAPTMIIRQGTRTIRRENCCSHRRMTVVCSKATSYVDSKNVIHSIECSRNVSASFAGGCKVIKVTAISVWEASGQTINCVVQRRIPSYPKSLFLSPFRQWQLQHLDRVRLLLSAPGNACGSLPSVPTKEELGIVLNSIVTESACIERDTVGLSCRLRTE